MDKTITEAAGLLRQASDMLLSIEPGNSSESPMSEQRPSHDERSESGRPHVADRAEGQTRRTIQETLVRARSMMSISRRGGTFRRLSSNERLRATSEPKEKKSKKTTQTVSGKNKPFEFALLGNSDESDEQDDTLKKDMILDRGIVTLNEKDNEDAIREKLKSALQNKYSMIGVRDFEFVKVHQKKISILYVSKGTEYNFDVVKKLAGQGLLYIRIRNGFEFALENPSSSDSDLPQVGMASAVESKTEPEVIDIPDQIPLSAEHPGDNISVNYVPPTSPLHVEPTIEEIPDFFDKVVNELPSSITEPAEMLRYLQKKIVKGRPLEINDTSVDLKGETNFITVDRDDILQTTFDELKNVADPSITFQVQFYGEQAADNGGPRKE